MGDRKKRYCYMKYCSKIIFKILTFVIIGIFIFAILQKIFIPKRFPYDKSNDTGKLRYFIGEEENSVDLLVLGTSHSSRGILPMEMYELYGIKSYNLSTSVQPIEVTYYILQEAIKTQNPNVVIWDVSSLYINYADTPHWKMAMDEMKIGKNKERFIEEYLKSFYDTGETMADLLFPLLGYHTRWKELVEQDFKLIKNNKRYFSKGGQINSTVMGGIPVDDMNAIAEGLMQNTVKEVREYNNQVFNEWYEENILYSINIVDSNREWVIKIKELCDANNIQFLAIKVPNAYMPQWYASAWTEEKYKKTKIFCDEIGITYYDMLYDIDLNIDFEKDSYDSGMHLNLYGAQKVSGHLGKYLKEHYQLSEERNKQWDKDLVSYQKVRELALLELEQDFSQYIDKLANGYKDKTIFIAASDDMSQGLNETELSALRSLGLQEDYSKAFQRSYIAVIEDGQVKYEALSNRPLDYSGKCYKTEKKYELHSSGWWTAWGASIKLDGNEYAVNSRGLNIVVYDDERGLVLDSVGFDTCMEYHTPIRNNEMINNLEEEFEYYIMEVEDNG